MKCKTCVNWQRHSDGGWCGCPKIREDHGKMERESDELVYSYDEGGSFWTGPEFGCVHHSATVREKVTP